MLTVMLTFVPHTELIPERMLEVRKFSSASFSILGYPDDGNSNLFHYR